MTANVVSAMLSITGVQSSLPVEDTRLSMAPFMMSIPGDITQESLSSLGSKNLQHEVFQWVFEFTYRSRHRRHPQIVHMKLLHQLGLWHGKLCREKHKNTNFNIRTHTHTQIAPKRFNHVTTSKANFQKSSPHTIIGLKCRNKQTLLNILIYWGTVHMIRAQKTQKHVSLSELEWFPYENTALPAYMIAFRQKIVLYAMLFYHLHLSWHKCLHHLSNNVCN